jgi:hypothetical protein
MDWNEVNFPKIKKPRRYQCGELADLDHWKVVAASKILKKSVSACLQTATYTWLQRNWAEYEERIRVEASIKGLTPEEYFNQLINDEEDQSDS